MRAILFAIALAILAAGATFLLIEGRDPFLRIKKDIPSAVGIDQNTNTGNANEVSPTTMTISSPFFKHNGGLYINATCGGKGVNPPLEIGETPKGAKSLALIVSDPDAPGGTFYHWLVWNIDSQTRIIKENSVPEGAIQGINSDQRVTYVAACPPSGTHQYIFSIYALDDVLDLPPSTAGVELERAIESHVLDSAHIIGLYR
jgi:hypothetical protein